MATEGLIAIERSSDSDFKAFFFNPDGSSGVMCGNGGRCAVFFARESGLISKNKKKITFEMAGKLYKSEIEGETISLFFPPPDKIELDKRVKVKRTYVEGSFVNVNSDHFVIDFKKAEPINKEKFREFCIDSFAPAIRYSEVFYPNGVNVNIFNLVDRKKIELRTYERGVEAETGACGTGALSTAVVAASKGLIDLPVEIEPPSEIPLFVDIKGAAPDEIEELILTGPAEIKKTAEIELPEYSRDK